MNSLNGVMIKLAAIALLSIVPAICSGQNPDVETRMIWDKGSHNAFTDLVRYKSALYCTFREGNSHVPKNTSENGSMMILLRRESWANGMLGISQAPYSDWKWTELNYRLGGPDFLVLKNELLIGTRLYKSPSNSTMIYITDKQGKVKKTVPLPSGGDTSYPGMPISKKYLLVSYYSSHEGKSRIYLARIKMKDLLAK